MSRTIQQKDLSYCDARNWGTSGWYPEARSPPVPMPPITCTDNTTNSEHMSDVPSPMIPSCRERDQEQDKYTKPNVMVELQKADTRADTRADATP
mmetsp:Transcript_82331/g.172448  ORF Transcript_82331/g.172448 Transcript_82331/m.172448 type:complete len:95 (-) Transcript_82331:169-453(-)